MISTKNELRRNKLIVSYNGFRFNGFQRQNNGTDSDDVQGKFNKRKRRMVNNDNKKIKNRGNVTLTVQEVLEDALEFYSGLNRKELKFRFAGRTDSGVHSSGQVVAVFLPYTTQEDWEIRKGINSRLPNDISVDHISKCSEDFNPRLDAQTKRYSYTLRFREKVVTASGTEHPISSGGGPQLFRNALDSNTIWICPWALDNHKIEDFCKVFSGSRDYTLFVHKKAQNTRNNKMTVNRFDCKRKLLTDGISPIWEIKFILESKGFGRSQVRNMVGWIVDCCRGAIKYQDASSSDSIWNELQRTHIHAAPACGLMLEHVIY